MLYVALKHEHKFLHSHMHHDTPLGAAGSFKLRLWAIVAQQRKLHCCAANSACVSMWVNVCACGECRCVCGAMSDVS